MDQEIREIIEKLKNTKRYNNFTFFDEAKKIKDLIADKQYDLIQVHDMTPIGGEDAIVGFAGTFTWDGEKPVPADGDTYNADMTVWGCNEFANNGKTCLDILSADW